MNTVTVTVAAEPHLVTTMTNSTPGGSVGIVNGIRPVTVVANSYSAGVPTLVTNGMGGGRTNLAGPQEEEEEKMEGGSSGGEESRLNLLNSSPDEHEPLLRREQPPAERDHLHHHHQPRSGNILSGRGSNSNNNNNRLTPGSEVKIQSSQVKVERSTGSGVSRGGGISCPKPHSLPTLFLAGQAVRENALSPTAQVRCQRSKPGPSLQSALVTAPVLGSSQAPVSAPVTSVPAPGAPGIETPAPAAPAPETSAPAPAFEAPAPEAPGLETSAPAPEAPGLETSAPAPGAPALKAQTPSSATEAPAPETSAPAPEAPGLSEPQMRQAKARRPERPCSLDLSPSCTSSSTDASLMDDGSRSVSGEKIKRRIKTPYALKKWRPATWVVSTDTTFDLDSEVNNNSSGHFSSNHHRLGNNGISKINQSKSSMAVFLVGGGATATMTSDPNGMTCL